MGVEISVSRGSGGVSQAVGGKSGQFYCNFPHSALTTTNVFTNSRNVATPIVFARSGTLDRIGTDCTVAGNAGSLVRLGLWNDDGSNAPGSLVADFGTQDGTATGFNPITINQSVVAGTLYWLTFVVQSAGVTIPTLRSFQTTLNHNLVGNSTGGTATSRSGYYDTASGALPASFTFSGGQTVPASAVAAIWVRFA